MTIKDRISAFSELGDFIRSLPVETREELHLIAAAENPWFTPNNVDAALNGISHFLKEQTLTEWAKQYQIKNQAKIVGVVMAGNIPLVGFHDMLCVLMSGNILKAKLSSKDTSLMRFFINKLVEINKSFENRIVLADQLKDIEAIIATGSDNSSRYFDYYFSKYPHIIRKNRTSCAVLKGDETHEQLTPIGLDIFQYFGLGCRNVSKLFVPKGYEFNTFFEAIEGFNEVKHHHKYANNYDYNKSIYLVNKNHHLDNGFLLLKRDETMVSPISVVYYDEYDDKTDLKAKIDANAEKIQCIVGLDNIADQPIGQAQLPAIDDYADGVDTMNFLTRL